MLRDKADGVDRARSFYFVIRAVLRGIQMGAWTWVRVCVAASFGRSRKLHLKTLLLNPFDGAIASRINKY